MGDAYPDLVANRDVVTGDHRARGGRLPHHPHPRRHAARRRPSPRAAPRCRATSPSSSTTPSASRSRSPRRWPPSAASASTSTTFDALMPEQRTRAKEAGKKGDVYANRTSFQQILDDHGPTEFVGREEVEAKAAVLAVVPGEDGTAVDLPRPHAVLRGVRRPGRRHRRHHHRHRARPTCSTPPTACPGSTATTRALVEGTHRARPGGHGRHRRRPPRRHPPQPHRHPRPALGAARRCSATT